MERLLMGPWASGLCSEQSVFLKEVLSLCLGWRCLPVSSSFNDTYCLRAACQTPHEPILHGASF